jgi:hypothetical protein
LELLTAGMVQKWIEGLLHPAVGDGINPRTVNSYLASIRNYWEWLQSHDHVLEGSRPFWNRKVNGKKTEAKQAGDDRERFEPADVVRLWQTAEKKHDLPLAHAIMLAAYIGRDGKGFAHSRSLPSAPIQRRRFLSFIWRRKRGRVGVMFQFIRQSGVWLMTSSTAP